MLVTENLETHLSALRDRYGVPGFGAVVVRKKADSDEYEEEYLTLGYRDEEKNPVDEHTLFTIASNSKLFCAISAGLLVEDAKKLDPAQPKFSWESKIKDIIPEWKLQDPIASEYASVLDILGHTTGLPRHDLMHSPTISRAELVSRMRHLRPSAEFRSKCQYNNICFEVASLLPERVCPPATYENFTQERILDPLRMKWTTFDSDTALKSGKKADGFAREEYDILKRGGAEEGNGWMGELKNVGCFQSNSESEMVAAAGIMSSTRDMANWLKCLLSDGQSPFDSAKTIIPSSVISTVSQPRSVFADKPEFPDLSVGLYGLGQITFTYRGIEIVEHGGGMTGHLSNTLRVPSLGIGIFSACNDHEFGGMMNSVFKWGVLDRVLGLEPIDWENRIMNKMLQEAKNAPKFKQPVTSPRDPEAGFATIAGTWNHPALGDWTFFPTTSTRDSYRLDGETAEERFPDHPYIGSRTTKRPGFVAYDKRTLGTWLLLEHHDCNGFLLKSVWETPATGVVRDASWKTYVLIEGDELGVTGLWGAQGVPDKEMRPGKLADNAEYVFRRAPSK